MLIKMILFGCGLALSYYIINKYYTAKRKSDDPILRRVQSHLDELRDRGFEVAAIYLQGSQNYGLEMQEPGYWSDVDTKAIVVPSFEDVALGKDPVSETIELANGEQIDVKDVRLMCANFEKQNVSYLELLFTEWKIVNPKYRKALEPLWEARSRIAAFDKVRFVKAVARNEYGKEESAMSSVSEAERED